MHYKSLAILLSASAVLSAPLEVDIEQDAALAANYNFSKEDIEPLSRFSVPAIPNPNFERDGFHELKKAYLKYKRHFSGLVIPPGLLNYTKGSSKLDARQNKIGTVTAKPTSFDSMYISPITVGSQTLNMDFDTGSSDLWVFSDQLSSTIQNTHTNLGGKIYKTGAATKLSGASWTITYADESSASGTVVTDSVKIGGITVNKQAVEVATSMSDSFVDFAADGLLGLAFSTLNQVSPTKQTSWMENAMPLLKSKLFGVELNRQAIGSYTWGFINGKYTKKMSWAKIRSTGWWHVDATGGIKVNGKAYTDGKTNSNGAVPDTGSTLLLLPDSIAKLYYAQVPGAIYRADMGAWVYPCTSDSSDSMPSISVPVGNYWAEISGKFMTYAYANSANTLCFGGLQTLSSSDSLPYIYGDVFFKGAYSVFDYGNRRFGFASKTSTSSTGNSFTSYRSKFGSS